MKTVLVPTDFSSTADKALDFAINIGQKSGAEIILLHVCDLFDTRLSRNKDLLAEHNRLVTSDLNRKMERYRVWAAEQKVTLTAMLYSGQPVQTILAVSAETNADLIVMGTQGATGLKSVFLGTNSARVLSRSSIPVLTIPCEYNWKEPRKILIAANDEKSGSKLDPVVGLAKLFNANLLAATISPEGDDKIQTLHKARVVEKISSGINTKYAAVVESLHLTGKNFYSVMNEFISAEQIDILVMFTHERNIIENIFSGSMTRKMAYHTHIPLLSIKL